MLGMGEAVAEVLSTIRDMRGAGSDALTLGQYLAPSARHHPLARFVTPDEFRRIGEEARSMGFRHVSSGPLVRSSYRADEVLTAKSPLGL